MMDRSGTSSPQPGAKGLANFSATIFAGVSVPPREWVAKDLIPARKVTLLTGDGGTGKSTLALQLAVAVATGGTWLGQLVSEGRVLYLSAEDDRDELHRRLADMCLATGTTFDQIENLRLVDLSEVDAVMATAIGFDIEGTKLFLDLETTLSQLRPKLVIIDSLADFFGGDEIKRRHVVTFLGMFRRLCGAYNLTVLILGHPSVAGMSSGSGTSGSSAWNNSVRSRLYFERQKSHGGNPAESDIRILLNKKANYGPAGTEIKMRWQAGVFVVTEIKRTDRLSQVVAEKAADEKFLELLDRLDAEGRTVSNLAGRNYAPTLFAAGPHSGGMTMQGFKAAMARLFNSGKVRAQTEGPASRQRNRIIRVAE